MRTKMIFVAACTAFVFTLIEAVKVEVKQGQLIGFESTSVLNDTKYYSFLGIPYATPPLGELRFQPPVAAEKWTGTWDATFERDGCPQAKQQIKFVYKGNEDCLYLNVYTPQKPSYIKEPKTVMVWIHGGGFVDGSGSRNFSAPDYLINYDIILVTINYRLHALGFLSLNIPEASGNVGLKDQTLALKWIRENIRNFGGDPEKITIFGQSAGAASVQLHTLSPLSKGLFQKLIAESGNALSKWTINTNPIESAFTLAKLLNYKGNNDTTSLLQFLKTQPADLITEKVHKMNINSRLDTNQTLSFAFGPVVETIKENAFLPDWPKNLLPTAYLGPSIIGFVEIETYPKYIFSLNDSSALEKYFVARVSRKFDGKDPSQMAGILAKVKKFYFGDQNITIENRFQLLTLGQDSYLARAYESLAVYNKSNFPPYIYQFAYKGGLNKWQSESSTSKLNLNGTVHSEELGYLFHIRRNFPKTGPIEIKTKDLKVIHNMCSFWTNFAKFGNPSYETGVDWKPSSSSNPSYIRISVNPEIVQGRINERGVAFWEELFKSENVSTIQS